MALIPYIRNYKPFFIQTDTDSTAWGTEVYGLVAKSNPYPILPNPKDPYSNDWKDEDGEDEYVAVQHFKSQEISVKFYCRVEGENAEAGLRRQITDFFGKIRQGEFLIYDSHTGVGRRKVRYAGYDEDSFYAMDGYARTIFTVKFKVNDPVTSMYYNPATHRITSGYLLGVENGAALVTEDGRYVQII